MWSYRSGTDKCRWEVISIVSHSFTAFLHQIGKRRYDNTALCPAVKEKIKISDFNLLTLVFCCRDRFCGDWCGHKNSGLRPEGGRGVKTPARAESIQI
jgi:hypothetical protein